MAGKFATKLEAVRFAPVTEMAKESNILTLMGKLLDPGLLTDTTLKPRVFGKVTPDMDWLCDADPPPLETLVKL